MSNRNLAVVLFEELRRHFTKRFTNSAQFFYILQIWESQ